MFLEILNVLYYKVIENNINSSNSSLPYVCNIMKDVFHRSMNEHSLLFWLKTNRRLHVSYWSSNEDIRLNFVAFGFEILP